MNIKFLASTLVFTAFSITPAIANEVVVNDVAGIPSSTDWGTIPGENTGTAVVTSTVARSGNGSLELKGDRTRTQLGIQYAPFRTTIASLADITSLTFDWRIAGDAVPRLNSDYTPALRLLSRMALCVRNLFGKALIMAPMEIPCAILGIARPPRISFTKVQVTKTTA